MEFLNEMLNLIRKVYYEFFVGWKIQLINDHKAFVKVFGDDDRRVYYLKWNECLSDEFLIKYGIFK